MATLERILDEAGKREDQGESRKQEAAAGTTTGTWPTIGEPGTTRASQKLLFYTTSATTSPHDIVLPLVFAVKAREKGHSPVVFLAGDATLLVKDGVLEAVRAPGQPEAAALVKRAVALEVPIFL